ncbi:TetR/AcrR family transcriptional regulator [Methylophaga thalassica]|uniref:TetR/AcrR family transcriptional regulator n=1 Tax=Methylophaga aminisulfidivorans TaxID=230105 RepID=UPI0005901432|nr:TetR/AcrR family transcriptional regulator [Methylophaga aminisulfidivorans]
MCASSCKDKHQAILSASLKLLAEKGFHGFSIKQLSNEAGVAAGTIYLYFKDKDALIADLHSTIISAVAKAIFKNKNGALPIKDQHRQMCLNLWQFCLENESITLCKPQFDHLPMDVLHHLYDDTWSQLKPIAELYEQGRQQGVLKNLPDDVLSAFSFEPIVNLAGQQLRRTIDITNDDLNTMLEASWSAISTSTIETQ